MNCTKMLSLLAIYIQALPRACWFFVFFLMSPSIIDLCISRESSGIGTCLSLFPTLIFSGVMGMCLFTQGVVANAPWGMTCIPYAEFVLTRPIPRYTAYMTGILLCCVIMLLSPLLSFGFSLWHPDLELSLYHDKTQKTEAYEKLDAYRLAFPDSKIVKLPKSHHETLVIPYGWNFAQGLQFWLVTVLFLGLQMLLLLNLPSRLPAPAMPILAVVAALSISLFFEKNFIAENGFFFFAHHWVAISTLTFLAFVGVQLFAKQRISRMEAAA